MYEELKRKVYRANIALQKRQLVICSWGNVSGIDRVNGVVAIKPSGIAYDELTPAKIVLTDLEGQVIEGDLKPSSDLPTHLELYHHFSETGGTGKTSEKGGTSGISGIGGIGGICHTHSPHATMWAQACREIPCLGTTHADYFHGNIPLTDLMSMEEIQTDYERNTGKVIIRRFRELDPLQVPAVLVASHGPFTWGTDPATAVESAVILEEIAKTALGTLTINPEQKQISKALLDKHYLRKHGKQSYYGQK